MASTTSENLTARAARWSASHRRRAVLGWLAFVFAAFALGNAAGTVTLKSQDQGNDESRTANQILGRQFPRDRAIRVAHPNDRPRQAQQQPELARPEQPAGGGLASANCAEVSASARAASSIFATDSSVRTFSASRAFWNTMSGSFVAL